MAVDLNKLVELMAEFEQGKGDFSPFDAETILDFQMAERCAAFLEGCAIPDTELALEAINRKDPAPLDFALAGFLQGLSIGGRYGREVAK